MLDASGGVAFKIWKLWQPLKYLAVLTGIAALLAVAWYFWYFSSRILLNEVTVGGLGMTIVVFVAGWLAMALLSRIIGARAAKTVAHVMHWRDTLIRLAVGLGFCLAGWFIAAIHLAIFDPLYLWMGSVERLMKKK